jgi:hypothetical protein
MVLITRQRRLGITRVRIHKKDGRVTSNRAQQLPVWRVTNTLHEICVFRSHACKLERRPLEETNFKVL